MLFGRPLVDRLVDRASQVTGVPKRLLAGHCRLREVAYARFAVMKVANEHGRSMPVIGSALGGYDHTSVMYGICRADELAARYDDYADLLSELRAEAAR